MPVYTNALAPRPANSLAYGPRNLMGTQMLQRPDEAYLRQQFPGLYGALGGLLATAPDVMEGSVLDPNTAAVRQGAEYTFPVGTALGMLPGVGPLLRATKGLPVGMGIKDVSSVYPQAENLILAQQRAALPVSQGGLGLPAGNTAEQRAAAMGGKEMVHFSRAGGDYTTLDSGKFAIAPFDAVGTHVGTPQAAMERFQNTVGYKVNNPNYANDELRGASYPVTILGDRPMMNQNNMPFGEDDLNTLLRQQGGHNWSDIQGGKMTYQDMNANLRKKLFEEQGYTSIPYYNEVEGKGSISYITPPENIRSRFAAFDPFRRSAAIAATMGVAAPDLLAAPASVADQIDTINEIIKKKRKK